MVQLSLTTHIAPFTDLDSEADMVNPKFVFDDEGICTIFIATELILSFICIVTGEPK